jgi:hypothetical protein
MEITYEIAKKVLDTVDAGLVDGIGDPIPGKMCVEAAVCYAMGLPHGDIPPCVSPALRNLKMKLNDSYWASESARANGLRELALLQLGTAGVLDEVEFAKRVILLVINKYLPPMLRKINLNQEAEACEKAKNLDTARDAARDARDAAARDARDAAARDARDAVTIAYFTATRDARATNCAVYTSYAAADARDAVSSVGGAVEAIRNIYNSTKDDKTLFSFAKDVAGILIDMKVPGVQWLSLLENNKNG